VKFNGFRWEGAFGGKGGLGTDAQQEILGEKTSSGVRGLSKEAGRHPRNARKDTTTSNTTRACELKKQFREKITAGRLASNAEAWLTFTKGNQQKKTGPKEKSKQKTASLIGHGWVA